MENGCWVNADGDRTLEKSTPQGGKIGWYQNIFIFLQMLLREKKVKYAEENTIFEQGSAKTLQCSKTGELSFLVNKVELCIALQGLLM